MDKIELLDSIKPWVTSVTQGGENMIFPVMRLHVRYL